MRKEEYLFWTKRDRAGLLLEKGVFLESVIYYGYTVKLYSLYNFFVEVYYRKDHDRHDRIEWIDVAEDDDLTKYLGKVKIDWAHALIEHARPKTSIEKILVTLNQILKF
jgi:hypothetical protein